MKHVVAFDESGNSGANLLDPEQPVFALASLRVSDDLAAEILCDTAKELKFNRLRRSADGRQKVLRILNSELANRPEPSDLWFSQAIHGGHEDCRSST